MIKGIKRRANFNLFLQKQRSSYTCQTLWIFLNIIAGHFGAFSDWSRFTYLVVLLKNKQSPKFLNFFCAYIFPEFLIQVINLTARFIIRIPMLLNMRSFISICCKHLKIRDPNLTNFNKEMYARGASACTVSVKATKCTNNYNAYTCTDNRAI